MDTAGGAQRVVQRDAIAAAPAVDERHHAGTQVALIVEHVATQLRVDGKGRLERLAQGGRRRLDLWVTVNRRNCAVKARLGIAR
jgi:hypothetical protein